jgi:hypothetical protein
VLYDPFRKGAIHTTLGHVDVLRVGCDRTGTGRYDASGHPPRRATDRVTEYMNKLGQSRENSQEIGP